jgi:hypothetical protein
MNPVRNIICPVSAGRIPEILPRTTAFLISLLFLLFLMTGFIPIVVVITFDFFARGFNYSHISPVFQLAKLVLPFFGNPRKMIDKAPKMFAARLGFAISLSIVVLTVFDVVIAKYVLSLVMILFSALEWALNLCVGCILYSLVSLFFYKQKK